ncbi:MAG: InlB B-repeat-containing protein [Bacteroidales bacterium]|nr:InlB B-repeat-containing protein [Bacteroidales bacterium]
MFSETVASETKATAPLNPIRTGYTFTGWDVDFSKITRDLIITAQYKINSYTVVFQDFDGTELFSETVAFETKATAPINPSRTGYTFTGWDVDFGKVTNNLTVVAQYSQNGIDNYFVTFVDWNNAILKTETVAKDNSAKGVKEPVRTGYTFTGWDVDFSKITKDLIVTAQYSINSYFVVFQDFDETELLTETVAFETSANAPINPTRTGYTFTGWDVDFSKITKDLTVTAQYKINSYSVVFQDFDGTELFSEKVAFEKAATAPKDPIRSGYTFTGWDIDFSKITKDLTVTAQYKINSYSVVFQDFDGTELFSETVTFETSANAPINPSRTGYTFTDWNVDFSKITKDLTVTAQYKINNYTVVFQDSDGTELLSETVAFETSATAPINPIRTGYTFTGWDIDFSKITKDLTVTAQYKINSYDVVFQDFDGSELLTEKVAFENAATAPINPSRTGYTFTGWDTDFSNVTRNLTITAQYSHNTEIEVNDLNVSIQLYPNPASENITIQFDRVMAEFSIQLFDLNSKLIYSQNNTNVAQDNLNITKLSDGVYFVKVICDEGIIIKRVVKLN